MTNYISALRYGTIFVLANGKTEAEVTSYCHKVLGDSCNVTGVDVDLSSAINKCVIDVKVTFRTDAFCRLVACGRHTSSWLVIEAFTHLLVATGDRQL